MSGFGKNTKGNIVYTKKLYLIFFKSNKNVINFLIYQLAVKNIPYNIEQIFSIKEWKTVIALNI